MLGAETATGLQHRLAGLLDVPYDELRQRERQRRFWQRLRWAAALAARLADNSNPVMSVMAFVVSMAAIWIAVSADSIRTIHPRRSASMARAAFRGFPTADDGAIKRQIP